MNQTGMDITLIEPPLSLRERYGRSTGEVGGHLPPLGLASLAAYVRKEGYSVSIVDGNIVDKSLPEIVSLIHKDAKVVGLTVLTSNFHQAKALAEEIQKTRPDVLVVLGGHHATICKEEILRVDNCFDVIVYGEGEDTLLELLDEYKKSGYDKKRFLSNRLLLKKINGIGFNEKDRLIITPPRSLIEDLDALPFPARDLLPMEKYSPLPNNYMHLPATSMVVIRGCPHNCSFCSNNAIYGRKIRSRSPGKVVEEMKHLKEKYGIREISFWDDTLTIDQKWLTNLCNLIIKERIDILWTCFGRVNSVNPKLLNLIKKAGCWNIFYGIETGSQKLLDNINKGITVDQIRKVVTWTKEAGIEIRGSFMLALPGETPALAEKTIQFAKELDVDYAQFCITTPYPGTKLYIEAEKYGRLIKNYSKYQGWEPVFIPYGYKNKDEIKKMSRKAMRSFYLRPKFIIKRLSRIRSMEDVKRDVKGLRLVLGFLT